MSDTQKSGNKQDTKSATSKGRREEPRRRQRTFETVGADFGQSSSSLLDSREDQPSFLSKEPSSILSRQPSDIMRPPANAFSGSGRTKGKQLANSGRSKANKQSNSSGSVTGNSPAPALSSRIQAKLAVGPANNAYEQEANHTAAQVMNMSTPVQAPSGGDGMQREQAEANVMGAKALQMRPYPLLASKSRPVNPRIQMSWESEGSKTVPKAGTNVELQAAITKLQADDNSTPAWIRSRAKRSIGYVKQIMNWKVKYFGSLDSNWDRKPIPARKNFIRKMLTIKGVLPDTFDNDWEIPANQNAWKREWKDYMTVNFKSDKGWTKLIKGLDLSLQKKEADEIGDYKWGGVYTNRDGNLPGIVGAGGYSEYYAEPALDNPPSSGFFGKNRIVAENAGGRVWVTADHYTSFKRVSDVNI